MQLTRDCKQTMKARAEQDRPFREALLTEALDCFLAWDTDTGKTLLRDYINATIGKDAKTSCVCLAQKAIRRLCCGRPGSF